jgi:dTDP-4-dehydrorhamnose 3,5-epimerase
MEVITTPFAGLLILKPKIYNDSRGFFFESYNKDDYHNAGINCDFVQDNQSLSNKGVLRGLHFQNPPHAQDKLVRVIQGRVIDVVVDIRQQSPTYGQHFKLELSGDNNLALFVPKGFAHGFICLEDNTLFYYKCSGLYNRASESGLLWNDKALGIDWGTDNPIMSEKDLEYKAFATFNSLFH